MKVLSELALNAIIWISLSHIGLSLQVTQTLLANGRLTSVYPHRGSAPDSGGRSALLYIPSRLSLRPSNIGNSVRNDEHFVSLLADRGHTVHCLQVLNDACSTSHLQSCITESLGYIAPRTDKIVLIANELSCLDAMQFVTNPANDGHQVHGLFLIDPPPLYSVHTEYGRRQILQKYAHHHSDYFTSAASGASYFDLDTIAIPALATSDLMIHTTEGDVDIQALALQTQEEVEYYDRKLQKELFKRPAVSVRINKHKAFYRRQLNRNTPKVGPTISGSSIDSHEIHSQQELNENLLSLLESGVLQSSDILGDTFPTRPWSVINTSVLVVATPFIATQARSNMIAIEDDHRIHEDSSAIDVAKKKQNYVGESSEPTIDTEHSVMPLFDEADKWGIPAATETANMFSAYPLQVIPPCSPEQIDCNLGTGLDSDWSREEIHINAEIARLLDIFVRKLSY